MTFKEENDAFLASMLNARFFDVWKKDDRSPHSLWSETDLEIYLTANCNQHCEYCYLTKFKGLYPKEFDNQETVLKNLKVFFDWCIKEGYSIHKLEFFTGEIWAYEYGLKVLQITIDAIKRGFRVSEIMIPSNCSFILSRTQTNLIQNYIDDFNRRGIRLMFSISVDGKELETKTRPLNNGKDLEKNDSFYELLFAFAYHNNFCFHPMVSSISVNKWVENFKWFEKMCAEYNMDVERYVMMLEVRNDDWTDETIREYLKFLDYLIERKFAKCGKNVENFADVLFNLKYAGGMDGYINYALPFADTFQGCTVSNTLTVRMGDLAIAPCHRTAYDQFLYGKYTTGDDGQITGIEANNIQMAVRVLYSNSIICSNGCDVCRYNSFCMRGCYGSQYENTGDPFMPMPIVCKLFKSKWKFIISKYKDMGLLKYLSSIDEYDMSYQLAQSVVKKCEVILNDGSEYVKLG